MSKQETRLRRQFAAIARGIPPSRMVIDALLHGRLRLIRVPIATLLILGGLLAIFPVFGLWMLPVGLLLLAVDIPLLRPTVSAALIRIRRRIGVWRHRRRR